MAEFMSPRFKEQDNVEISVKFTGMSGFLPALQIGILRTCSEKRGRC